MGRKFLSDVEQLWTIRPPIITLIVLVGGLPLVMVTEGTEMKTAYVLVVMAVLWLTESIPIPVTSLLPVVLLPALGVLPAKDVSKNYINDTSMLFMGGLIVAVAVEEWNLHKRIALGVLRIVGSDPKMIMAGLMLPTWFLSMWISNTATTSMMVPIVQAVLVQLKTSGTDKERQMKHDIAETDGKIAETSLSESSEEVPAEEAREIREGNHQTSNPISVINTEANGVEKLKVIVGTTDDDLPEMNIQSYDLQQGPGGDIHDAEYNRLCKGLSLCVAYAANVGGIATLTGSPPNLVLKGQADILFEENGGESGINFANFMSMALPLSVMMLVICWFWLFFLFIRCNHCCSQDPEKKAAVTKAIQAEFRAMGRISFAECVILVFFLLFAVMLLTRSPANFPGWGSWFLKDYVSDSSSAMFISILLFILPAKIPTVFCWRYDDDGVKLPISYTPLLKWPMVHEKLPWGVLVLLGGGFALANACKESGLSALVGQKLEVFGDLHPLVANILFALVVALVTEVTSNTATATLLLPVVAELSIKVGRNPLYLMLTTAVATSFAFMLPVATPPNAIVFSHGHLRIFDMAIAGLLMNVVAVLCLVLCMETWGTSIYNLDVMPDIFLTNSTVASVTV